MAVQRIEANQVWRRKFDAREIRVLGFQTEFTRGVCRPFATLVEVEYTDGLTGRFASLPLGFFRSNFRLRK